MKQEPVGDQRDDYEIDSGAFCFPFDINNRGKRGIFLLSSGSCNMTIVRLSIRIIRVNTRRTGDDETPPVELVRWVIV